MGNPVSDPQLFDSDVLIDVLRSVPDAVAYLKSAIGRSLVSGVRDGREELELETLFEALEIIPVDRAIARLAGSFRRTYLRSHKLGLADALMAATAVNQGVKLVTLNRKHFPMLSDLIVPCAKP